MKHPATKGRLSRQTARNERNFIHCQSWINKVDAISNKWPSVKEKSGMSQHNNYNKAI